MAALGTSDWTRTLDYLRVLPQYVYPHHLLSRLAFRIARLRYAPIRQRLIRWFVHHYQVDLQDAVPADIAAYPDFNSFFTRPLRQGARPICVDPDAVVSPVDGEVSQIGQVERDCLLQAKGRTYPLADLLGRHLAWHRTFSNGSFVTIYLAPRDYHRVHMPVQGQLTGMLHVPGRLFSVNHSTTRVVSSLFTRNERLIMHFKTPASPFALVLVGALLVGNIETVWAGAIAPARSRRRQPHLYDEEKGRAIVLARGAEVARFNMGSTVIVLFPPGATAWAPHVNVGTRVVLGQRLGNLLALP